MDAVEKEHEYFVGIDSDGCVFDTMQVKQCQHFHPLIIKFWELGPMAPVLREVAEFVNLRSAWRGQNRFTALLKTFELLGDHPEAVRAGMALPRTEALRKFIDSGHSLGNPALREEVERTGDPELKRLLDWSLAINRSIDTGMRPCPPFDGVVASLERIAANADTMVVSQTPAEALRKEWSRHGIDRLVGSIAGQEAGTKVEQLTDATRGKYPPDRVLMIGDAPGDLTAAEQAGVLFFPIVPGGESQSWTRLRETAFDRFLSGTYAGDYADGLIASFREYLPRLPPW